MAVWRGWGIPLGGSGGVTPPASGGPFPGVWLQPSNGVYPSGVRLPVQTYPRGGTFPSNPIFPTYPSA